jgi:hydrogenase maturation protease
VNVLVAGVGNVFRGDDAFGVEVVRRLALTPIPPGVAVIDFGIRSLHLAFELLSPPELLVVVDAMSRGAAPGTIFLVDPEIDPPSEDPPHPDGHDLALPAVFEALAVMGGKLPRTRIVGCEPAVLAERMELSPAVAAAVGPAVEMIRRLIEREEMVS